MARGSNQCNPRTNEITYLLQFGKDVKVFLDKYMDTKMTETY